MRELKMTSRPGSKRRASSTDDGLETSKHLERLRQKRIHWEDERKKAKSGSRKRAIDWNINAIDQ